MRFFFSGELDSEIAEQYRSIRKSIEARLNQSLEGESYGEALEEIAIIPIILGPRFATGHKERRLVKLKEKSADYRLFIDFNNFSQGSTKERERLLLENVLNCIEDIDRKIKAGFDGKRLQNDIKEIFPGLEIDG
jgi:hypothetical protein